MENMRQFVKEKKKLGRKNPFLTWRFLVFRFNEEEKEQAKKIASEIGIDRILFAPPYIDHERFPDWIPSDTKYDLYLANNLPSVEQNHNPRKRCDWHYISSAINSDGGVAPCCGTFRKTDDFASIDYESGSGYMSAINNGKFVSVRRRFSGKGKQALDLVCENCPTPKIMNYANFVNKIILFRTAANILGKVRVLKLLQFINRKCLTAISPTA
jgi:hypothetical protein